MKVCTVVLDGLPLLICAIIHSICVMYIKLPTVLLVEALANLNWISKTWAQVGQVEYLQLSTVDTATYNAFMKAFEVFGEAIPQASFFWTNVQMFPNMYRKKTLGHLIGNDY